MRPFKTAILIPLLAFFSASLTSGICSASEDGSPLTPEYSQAFAKAQISANMQSNDLNELSGLIASHSNPGLYWAHNDSGDAARIFLIDPNTGEIKLEARLDKVNAVDFEDITLRVAQSGTHLIIGDIGDNRGVRDRLALYQIREPKLGSNKQIIIPASEIQTMHIRYEEGARDAETLMSDADGSLLIISKREDSNYIYQFDFEAGKDRLLTALARINIKDITAGDIHSSGAILLRNYAQIYYWPAPDKNSTKKADFSIIERLSKEAPQLVMTAPEPQGEAIAWGLETGFYSIPEKPFFFEQMIFYYPSQP